MASYLFSSLADGKKQAFNPNTDQLIFDAKYSANELIVYQSGPNLVFSYPRMSAGLVSAKTVTLLNMKLEQVTGRNPPLNIKFGNDGVLLVGNESTQLNDPRNGTDAGNNNLVGSDFNDMLLGLGGIDTLSGRRGNDTLDGGVGNDTLYGDDGDDKLLGGAGADWLEGGVGNDTMIGGDGSDDYLVDVVGDLVIETNPDKLSGGVDTVESKVGYTLPPNVENLTLSEQRLPAPASTINDTDATGNALANVITGNSGFNWIDGGLGADTMKGGGGDDVYIVDNTGDKVVEPSNANNTANDGTGYILIDWIDTVQASVNIYRDDAHALPDNVEHLRLMGSADLNGVGNKLDNIIYANTGNNLLKGGANSAPIAGNTRLNEYAEIIGDTVSYEYGATGGVTASLAVTKAQDTLGSGVDTLIGFENLSGSPYSDDLTGDSGPNILNGGSDLRNFKGDSGADVLRGGAGNDIYVVDGNDTIVETSAGGIDTVASWVNFRLPANVENLRLLPFLLIYPKPQSPEADAIGNDLNNTLTGNANKNLLDGGKGSDKMYGGEGDDTYVVDNPNDVVDEKITAPAALLNRGGAFTVEQAGTGNDTVQSFVSYDSGSAKHKQLEAGVENLRLMGSANLNATGNELDNILWANRGNNKLDGGPNKSSGDTVSYEFGAKAGVTVDLHKTTAQATGGSGADTLVNIENLTGSSYDDFITGNEGKNALDGGLGTDTVSYATAPAGVSVNLGGLGAQGTASGGGGADSVRNFENVVATKFDDSLAGTIGNNELNGGLGNDTVSYENATAPPANNARAGAGVVVDLTKTAAQNTGGSGYDKLLGIENVTGSKFNDVLTGTAGRNALVGLAGDDKLNGGGGDDALTGGLGKDTLTGGAGKDVFIFVTAPDTKAQVPGDSDVAATLRDVITDFTSGQDKIDVSLIDAKPDSGKQSWKFVGPVAGDQTPFTTKVGEVQFNSTTHILHFDLDGNAGNIPDFEIELTGVARVAAADIIGVG